MVLLLKDQPYSIPLLFTITIKEIDLLIGGFGIEMRLGRNWSGIGALSSSGVAVIERRLSRTGPLFKIIEMFSTCIGGLRGVSADLAAGIAAIGTGRGPITGGIRR